VTTSVTLHHGDSREHLRRLIDAGTRVHSVVCDPPYGLTSIKKRFGAENAAPAQFGTDGAFARASAGFMGSKWDGTGIERDPEFWRLVHDILLPGGYVVAFSGARTGHWQACAMEMAGFIMHPMFGWIFGTGFPKAHNAAKAIDREAGVTGGRGAPKSAAHAGWIDRGRMRGGDDAENNEGWLRPWMDDKEKVLAAASQYIPGTPEAQQWDGWAYGGQALKPALEPLYVGQRPFSEKNGALNLLKHGVGAINIDGCRVESTEITGWGGDRGGSDDLTQSKGRNYHLAAGAARPSIGRHPANLLHDNSPSVVALFPTAPGQQARASATAPRGRTSEIYGPMGRDDAPMEPRGDSGSAARFFNAFPMTEDLAAAGAAPVFYQPKASKADRAGSKHPTVKPIALMQWLVRLVTPPGGTVLDPFAGSGTTGEAARREGFDCILMEAEAQFAEDIRRRFGMASPVDEFEALMTA